MKELSICVVCSEFMSFAVRARTRMTLIILEKISSERDGIVTTETFSNPF